MKKQPLNKSLFVMGGLSLGAGIVYLLERQHKIAELDSLQNRLNRLLPEEPLLNASPTPYPAKERSYSRIKSSPLPALSTTRESRLRTRASRAPAKPNRPEGKISLPVPPTPDDSLLPGFVTEALNIPSAHLDFLPSLPSLPSLPAASLETQGIRAVTEGEDFAGRLWLEIGHLLSLPSALHMTAHNGQVILTGTVPVNEVEEVLATLGKVPGVTEIRNLLERGHATEEFGASDDHGLWTIDLLS